LKAITQVKEKYGVRTSLGISNVSFGLPERKYLNRAFLDMAAKAGLDAAIISPDIYSVAIDKAAVAVLKGKDVGAKEFILKFQDTRDKIQTEIVKHQVSSFEGISHAIIGGDQLNILSFIEKALSEGHKPRKIIDEAMLPAMDIVGDRFSKNIIFLPQVIASAESMKIAFSRVKKEIKTEEQKAVGKVIVATVKGDIHDIGKSIVATMLENSGFDVIDLGKDVPPQVIVESAQKNNVDIVMLSALLTTTMPQMKIVKTALIDAGLNIPVMVGGAPVTADFAAGFKANFSKDAAEAVKVAKKLIGK